MAGGGASAWHGWVLPLDVRRRGPRDGTPTALAVSMLREVRAAQPAATPRPVGTLDSGYDPVQLARARLPLDVLVRLRSNRTFYRTPGPYQGRGAPRKYGAVFKLSDPATHGRPDASASLVDPRCGRVQIDAWRDLRVRGAADAPFTVVRVQLERLPRRVKPPAPLWLAWIGDDLPADLADLWRDYTRRFTAEHGFRFLKQTLGWTTVRPRDPAAADRWTWLLALALWQLWLARPLVADQRLPWEQPRSATQLTPGRVRRAVAGLFLPVGHPGTPAQTPRESARPPAWPRSWSPLAPSRRPQTTKTGGLTTASTFEIVQTQALSTWPRRSWPAAMLLPASASRSPSCSPTSSARPS